MRRAAALACLLAAATLLPVQAEAARFRLGGRSSPAPAAKASRSVVVVPGIAGTSRAQAAETATAPQRVPFPPSSTPRDESPPLRLTSTESAQKPWCRSEVVVGGFCVLN
ncbi:conserved exported hypothetical protein [Hyphomicrobiales bacterium]|nr:conserved exported hypothetical protein [Hyphomicrobiales bacterium]CAH1699926.1 conserved exported hypothetical protein [Hyphomicrobiales bacterium]CAI0343685.1 conserved exported hypothetical protein [Hyphomicrobiales bacterium]